MNLVFWGQEHQCGTTFHMAAVTGMLRALCGNECVVTGRFLKKSEEKFAICDCGTGFEGRKRHFLWTADLVVVNLRPQRECVEDFFDENFHITTNMMFLLSEYDGSEKIDAEYLNRVYRIAPEQIGMLPYNSEFCQAMEMGVSDAFVARELILPTNYKNEQFVYRLQTVVNRMMYEIGYDFVRKEFTDRRKELWNRL